MDDEIKRLVEQGRAAYSENNYDRAVSIFEKLVQHSVRYADIYNMMGVIFYTRNNLSGARNFFRRALQINPNFANAAGNLMLVLNDLGVPMEERMAEFRELHAQVPKAEQLDDYIKAKLANMYADIGDIYDGANQFDNAVVVYRKALDLCPDYMDIRQKLARSLKSMDLLEEAVEQCRVILEKRPDHHSARCLMGLCHYLQDQPDEAARQWRTVLAKAPDHKLAGVYLRSMASGAVDQKLTLDES